MCNFRCLAQVAVGRENQEFVSAKSCALIARADAFAHGFRSQRNDCIASGMTTQIVDQFEIIDINEQHRIALLMPRQ